MTHRQLLGSAVVCFFFLILALTYWLVQIYWSTRPYWVFAIGSVVASAWGLYANSDFAKRRT
jgi:hypothetical protein